jgi:hypothetical protein
MSFLRSIFKAKDEPIRSSHDFWDWFQKNEKAFFKAVKDGNNIERDFFDKLGPKLREIKDGVFFVTGMFNDHTAELILTADGVIKNIYFVEELVGAASKIDGWKFTALKPALAIEDVSIEMAGYKFKGSNVNFYANNTGFPDEIDITVVHNDLDENNKPTITNGVYIFLDNFLGELNFATTIDNLTVAGKAEPGNDLVPIKKLKDFLNWRQREFIEKYEGVRRNTEKDNYSMLEATLKNGNPLLAVINQDLLDWDSKASHPWIMTIDLKYDGRGNNGMPDNDTYSLLTTIEDDIMEDLKDVDGYLNIGRQTAEGVRQVYFACKDFRKPSNILYTVKQKYSGKIDLDYDIYKDKYWQSFDRFLNR